MSISAVPFPELLPDGYAWFDNEPTFDPSKHLDLSIPEQVRFNPDSDSIANELELAISDVTKTISEMSDNDEHDMHHYEKS